METLDTLMKIAFVLIVSPFVLWVIWALSCVYLMPVLRGLVPERKPKSVGATGTVDFSDKRAREALAKQVWERAFLGALGEEEQGRVIEGAVLRSGRMEISAQGVRVLPSEEVSDEELGRLMVSYMSAGWRL